MLLFGCFMPGRHLYERKQAVHLFPQLVDGFVHLSDASGLSEEDEGLGVAPENTARGWEHQQERSTSKDRTICAEG